MFYDGRGLADLEAAGQAGAEGLKLGTDEGAAQHTRLLDLPHRLLRNQKRFFIIGKFEY